jgi:hypothetical protein
MDLLDRCLNASTRKYPDGYGFALAYLDDHLNPAHLRDGAFAVVSDAFSGTIPFLKKDSDLVAFVKAYADAKSFEGFAIEAAQLVHAAAMGGHANSCNVMALCGHPGY